MKLIITGAAGFIGSHFLELALINNIRDKQFKEIVVIDSLTYASNQLYLKYLQSRFNFKFVNEDITNLIAMSKIIYSDDYIVNFAAESHVDNSLDSSHKFIKSNVLGTSVLLELSKLQGVKRFIQISTDEVYGTIAQGSWDEECKVNPNSPYSASKASADLISISFFRSHGIPVIITRSSNNFGARQNKEKFIPKVVTNILNSTEIPVYGTGQNIRDWLYVKDNVLAIWSLLSNGVPGEIYNIGSGNELSNLELIEKISFLMKRKARTVYIPDRKAHDFRYSVSINKIQNAINFKPTTDLMCGLEETIKYYLEGYQY
jgi:dTDP-glucose 4,6-dehydratase